MLEELYQDVWQSVEHALRHVEARAADPDVRVRGLERARYLVSRRPLWGASVA